LQKLKQFPSLYFILDPSVCKNQNPLKIAIEVLKGGVKLLQLRDKNNDIRMKLQLAKKIQTLCKSYNATFIMNDHLDIALTLSTDGLHLGQTDFPFIEAKRLLGPDKILGTSNVTLEQAIESEKQGSDYIAIGSIYPTKTKKNIELTGILTLKKATKIISKPIAAIGGINLNNITEVLMTDVSFICISSAISLSDNPQQYTKQIISKINDYPN
tara:strand:- start:582 stop:1220 length:639 start_codon:yes stop_codon:yes gene_type:complete